MNWTDVLVFLALLKKRHVKNNIKAGLVCIKVPAK